MTGISKAVGLIAALRDALDAADLAFCKLARIQFEAPWRKQGPNAC